MRSTVRQSDLEALQERVLKENFRYYLRSMSVRGLRGFSTPVTLNFDFPVTALIGPNGGGKTTLLSAAGILYKGIKPSDHFVKSSLDDDMNNIQINYQIIDKDKNTTNRIQRTARFTTSRWSRDALDNRRVIYLGISRTIPATERKELYRYRSPAVAITSSAVSLNQQVVETVSYLMGRSNVSYLSHELPHNRELFTGRRLLESEEKNYSEYHFGAGEGNLIRIVNALESVEDYAFVLIEELENGLHPVAVSALLDYLLHKSLQKKLQILFTTHSQYAINVLPKSAIWSSIDFKLQQGKLDVESSLRVLGEAGDVPVFFVEDKVAASWLLTMFRYFDRNLVHSQIIPVDGKEHVLTFTRNYNALPTHAPTSRAIGVLDGDVSDEEIPAGSGMFLKFPGADVPERVIFRGVAENLTSNIGRLNLRMAQPADGQNNIRNEILQQLNTLDRDEHIVFSKLGDALGYVPEAQVRDAFIATWLEEHKSDAENFVGRVRAMLPAE